MILILWRQIWQLLTKQYFVPNTSGQYFQTFCFFKKGARPILKNPENIFLIALTFKLRLQILKILASWSAKLALCFITVVSFDRLSGAAHTWKLDKILFLAVFNFFVHFKLFSGIYYSKNTNVGQIYAVSFDSVSKFETYIIK